jgi:hypothetical protein
MCRGQVEAALARLLLPWQELLMTPAHRPETQT